jgi:hypothetical protein
MRLSSRALLPARETDTPWLPWAATSSYSEGTWAVRRHAARAGHRLGTCQILRLQLFRTLLLTMMSRCTMWYREPHGAPGVLCRG